MVLLEDRVGPIAMGNSPAPLPFTAESISESLGAAAAANVAAAVPVDAAATLTVAVTAAVSAAETAAVAGAVSAAAIVFPETPQQTFCCQ